MSRYVLVEVPDSIESSDPASDIANILFVEFDAVDPVRTADVTDWLSDPPTVAVASLKNRLA